MDNHSMRCQLWFLVSIPGGGEGRGREGGREGREGGRKGRPFCWGCAARFVKPWPGFWPSYANFFSNWFGCMFVCNIDFLIVYIWKSTFIRLSLRVSLGFSWWRLDCKSLQCFYSYRHKKPLEWTNKTLHSMKKTSNYNSLLVPVSLQWSKTAQNTYRITVEQKERILDNYCTCTSVLASSYKASPFVILSKNYYSMEKSTLVYFDNAGFTSFKHSVFSISHSPVN